VGNIAVVNKRFEWPVQVYYEDTDAQAVVYYARYLNFMERARTEWLRTLGFEQDRLAADENLLFAVRRMEIDFLRPARFNDRLSVSVEVAETRRASLSFRQEIRRRDDHRTLCDARVQVVCLNAAEFRPRPLPEPLLREMKREF
jgi:acyl-CoA thioester hydrolase